MFNVAIFRTFLLLGGNFGPNTKTLEILHESDDKVKEKYLFKFFLSKLCEEVLKGVF